MALDKTRLLAFAERLQSASDIDSLLETAAAEIRETLGYQTAWIAVFELDEHQVRVLAADGPRDADVWEKAPVFPIDSDPYMLRILHATTPQVVRDAQTDPDVNRVVVEALGSRTIVNTPMRLIDQPFGALGVGTFGDEGVRVPSEEELEYLTGLAGQLVLASARIILLRQREEAARERARIERLLTQRQRVESIGNLAGGVAHDFNNLLTVIMAGTAGLAEDERDPARQAEIALIADAAERAASLTQHLLALGQRQPLRLAPEYPSRILQGVVEMVRRVIPADIEIVLEEAPGLPPIRVDAAQIEQVITNLCLNARDAMPRGGRLTIRSEEAKPDEVAPPEQPFARADCYVMIGVHDTGHGIPAEILDQVFEPFFTTKSEGKGSGLGLAVCRGITAQHDGILDVRSEEGVGTTFRVFLPSADQEPRAAGQPPPTPASAGTERILVADDQRGVRRVLTRVLSAAGYAVESVSDGQEAVEAAARRPFDLLLLDAVMPRVGGRQAYDQIRELQPGVRVLFASGYGAAELTTRFLSDTGAHLL